MVKDVNLEQTNGNAEEAYAIIKTEAPFGAKSFSVVNDKKQASRITKLKNRALDEDDQHTYIYRKMDEKNSQKYNIPVNEEANKMGLSDELLELDKEGATANENSTVARPNSTRLLEMLDDYLDASSLAEELINWMPDDEVGRFAKEYGYFPEEPEEDEEEDTEDYDSVEKELFEAMKEGII